MKPFTASRPDEKAEPKLCERCLEPERKCVCLPTNLEDYEAPDVAWLASRPVKWPSKIAIEKKHRYGKACKEVERLNRLYAGKVQHFLMPVQGHD